jgi:hypothetical protein
LEIAGMNNANNQVFAVQCPSPNCRKFMLVEAHQQNQVVPCLICKTPIKVGSVTPPKA